MLVNSPIMSQIGSMGSCPAKVSVFIIVQNRTFINRRVTNIPENTGLQKPLLDCIIDKCSPRNELFYEITLHDTLGVTSSTLVSPI
jgi:hypothetical protein